MNIEKKLLAIFLAVFMLVSVMPLSLAFTVAATDSTVNNCVVYVSTDGSDSTGNGTEGNPYETLSKAMTVIEADNDATAGTIIISGDNAGAGIGFTSAAHTKMITIEGITSSILIDASNSGTWRQTQGPLTFDNISVKRLGLEPRGHELVIKEGVILEGVGDDRLNVRAGYNTSNGDTVYMGAYRHDTNTKDVYMYIGNGTVTGDLNIYINDIYAKSVDLRNATYNGNVNLTVNNYRKSSNGGDDLWIHTSAALNGALQVILNNGVRNIHKDRFRSRTPVGGKWLLYGEAAADGTILEMSDTVGVYRVKGDMTANAYKVTTSTNDFETDVLSETAITSNDGILDLRESGEGEYVIRYTYNRTVYVSTDGSDSTGDGTAENPYATLSKAMIEIEADDAAYAGTIIISGDNAGAGIAFSAATHTKMITVEGITPSIVIKGSGETNYKDICGPLTADNVTFKNLGLNPKGNQLILKDGVTLDSRTYIKTSKTEAGDSIGTVNGVDIYIDAYQHNSYNNDFYLTIGQDDAYTVNGDVNIYINNMYSKGLDIERGTYNGNMNLTVNNYQKSSENGDDIYLRNNGTVTISGALQVVLNNGVTTGKYKTNFRDSGPSGRTWLLYGETAVDGTILEMSDTVGVYKVKGGMTANAYKVTTSTSDFATDTLSETAVTSNDGVLDLRESGAGEYFIKYATPSFEKHSLVLADAIGVNFFMDLCGLSEEVKESTYMTFEVTKGDCGTVAGEQCNFTDIKAALKDDVNGIYGFTCYVNSVQMAENITPTFHYGDGETLTGAPYSVKDYIDYVTENAETFNAINEYIVPLVESIGNYGYYAQNYLGGLHDTLIFTSLGDGYADIYNSTIYNDYKESLKSPVNYVKTDDFGESGITKSQIKLNFDSNTSVTIKLTGNSSIEALVEKNGTAYTGEVNRVVVSTYCLVDVMNLPISELGDEFVITDEDGTYTVTFSGLSYVYSILNDGSKSSNAKNAVCAIYDYYKAAKAYQESLTA